MKTEILIVGAGFAGASTAYHLSRTFAGSITLLEREEMAGVHASGRNAGMVRQSVPYPAMRPLLARSCRAYADRGGEVGFRQTGSLLLAGRERLHPLRQPDLIATRFLTPELAAREIPLLSHHHFEAALHTPSDGVMDIAKLMQFYLGEAQKAGVTLRTGCEIRRIRRDDGLYQVETTAGDFQAECLVNAAGAWAAQIGEMAGAVAVPMVSFKRHLFLLSELPEIHPDWPFVWSLDRRFYFRPESEDLLCSVCDETPSRELSATVDPEISEYLAELIWSELPALKEAVQKQVWSCFRTRTPDGLFVIGWDPVLAGFFWVAGLGGHGMGASWEIGRLAADGLRHLSVAEAEAFSPGRFRLAATQIVNS